MSAHPPDAGSTPANPREPSTAAVTTPPATLSESTPLPPPRQEGRPFGPYELLEEIDRGGMGVVYKARQAPLDRLVALKMILAGPAARREEVLRFQREALAAGRLRHANIIAVHDAGTIDGQHYFTMPLARNGSLAAHVARLGADPRAAVTLVEKVARAVEHAHAHGILHRDLKPANILLDDGDEPWVADFGLAKVLDADELLTQTGHGLGTPAYMAPEQSGRPAGGSGPATDVWSLGVILYELLGGQRPFRGAPEAVVHKIRRDEPARFLRLRPEVGAPLEAVVLKCLAKDPAGRYPSAGALADDLARWLRGEAPLARPEGALGRARRWARRPAVAAGAVLLPLAAALAFLPRGSPDPGSAPPADTARSAEPPEAELRRRLAAREAVELIGPTGLPRYPVRQAVGGGATDASPMRDGTFTDQTWGLNLLELLAAVPWDEYRLRAEVQIRESDKGRVGVYFAYRSGTAPQGTEHSFCALLFTDRPPAAPGQALVQWELRWYGEPWKPPHLNNLATPRKRTVSTAGTDWRPLALVVTADGVQGSWGKETLPALTWPQLQQAAQGLTLDGPPGQEPPPLPRDGGLGLYLYRGTASFRNVVLEPYGKISHSP